MSGERTYCVALTKLQMAAVVVRMSGAPEQAYRDIKATMQRRLNQIKLEEQVPSPAPPLPLIAVEPTHTGIKFGGEI